MYATGGLAANNRIVINPATGSTINVPDTIYLNGNGTRIGLQTSLTPSIMPLNPLYIRVSNPAVTRVIVQAADSIVAADSVDYIKQWTGNATSVSSTDTTQIVYNGTMLSDAAYNKAN